MDVLSLSIRLVRVFQTLKVEPEGAFISGHLVLASSHLTAQLTVQSSLTQCLRISLLQTKRV